MAVFVRLLIEQGVTHRLAAGGVLLILLALRGIEQRTQQKALVCVCQLGEHDQAAEADFFGSCLPVSRVFWLRPVRGLSAFAPAP